MSIKTFKYKLLHTISSGKRKQYYKDKLNIEIRKNIFSLSDLSWEQFSSNILSKRNYYKGIFIQRSTIGWDTVLYQRPHHICMALSKLGYLVIYESISDKDALNGGFRCIEPNLWLTNNKNLSQIHGAVHSFYSTSPRGLKYIKTLGKSSTIAYEYIDHISDQINKKQDIPELEALWSYSVNGGANYIIASARELEENIYKENPNAKVLYIPNGVDFDHYKNVIPTNLPTKLVEFRKKYKHIVGFFGAMAPWLWYELINKLTKTRSDLGFVFIGPEYGLNLKEHLELRDNILWSGPVDYKYLPYFASSFDICFIPFKPGQIAKTTSPLKLFEYFALGKPVVVTRDMKECIQFKEVLSATSLSEFSSAIDQALFLSQDSTFCNNLLKIAEENSWLQRAKSMEALFQTTQS